MKSFIVLAVLVAAALAVPVEQLTLDGDAQILRYDSQRDENVQGYNYFFETSNGIEQQEEGQLVNTGAEIPVMIVRGSFKYLSPNGIIYSVTYTADQDGFHPSAEHLPVA